MFARFMTIFLTLAPACDRMNPEESNGRGGEKLSDRVYLFDDRNPMKIGDYIYQTITGRKLTEIYHSHDFYEIICMQKGSCVQRLNGEEGVLAEGDLIFLRPGDYHSFTGQSPDMACLVLSVRCSEFEAMADAMNRAFAGEIRSAAVPPHFPAPGALLAGILENGGILPGGTVYERKLLMCCFLKLYADHRGEQSERPQKLELALQQMQQPENLRLGIEALLSLTHYSRTHLARLIRRHYGMSPKQLVNDLRLKQACRDLVLTDRRIEEIAESLGFFSTSHFSRIFRRRYGITPAALRRRDGIRTV